MLADERAYRRWRDTLRSPVFWRAFLEGMGLVALWGFKRW